MTALVEEGSSLTPYDILKILRLNVQKIDLSRLKISGIPIDVVYFLVLEEVGFGLSARSVSIRKEKLYLHSLDWILGCRTCLKSDYEKHRYSKMVETG